MFWNCLAWKSQANGLYSPLVWSDHFQFTLDLIFIQDSHSVWSRPALLVPCTPSKEDEGRTRLRPSVPPSWQDNAWIIESCLSQWNGCGLNSTFQLNGSYLIFVTDGVCVNSVNTKMTTTVNSCLNTIWHFFSKVSSQRSSFENIWCNGDLK